MTCPRQCVECEGEEHHAGDSYAGTADDEPMHPAALAGEVCWWGCKHCDAWAPMVDADDDDEDDDGSFQVGEWRDLTAAERELMGEED